MVKTASKQVRASKSSSFSVIVDVYVCDPAKVKPQSQPFKSKYSTDLFSVQHHPHNPSFSFLLLHQNKTQFVAAWHKWIRNVMIFKITSGCVTNQKVNWFSQCCILYLCTKLSQYCQRLVVQEVGPLDVTLLLGIKRCKLGQNLLLLFISQVLIKLLLGCKVTVLQQLIRHQAWLWSNKEQFIASNLISHRPVFQI